MNALPPRTAPWVAALAAGPLAWVAAVALGTRPAFVEWLWGERIARWFAMGVGVVTGTVSFSVAELGGAVLGAVLAVWTVHRLRAGWRTDRLRGVVRASGALAVRALAAGSVGYAVFLLVWGVGARRVPVGDTLGYPAVAADLDALAGLYGELIEQTNALRAQMPEQDGVATPLGDIADVLARGVGAYARAGERWPLLRGRFAPPKPVFLSGWMSTAGISGIYIPFTGEPNVAVDGPAFTLAFSVCHEMAHQRGFTREDEANFVGYLVARDAGDLDFRYAASFMAQVYVARALGEADYPRWRQMREGVAPGVLADADAYLAWYLRKQSRASDVTRAVNDTYLRSQGSSGMQSYGEVVDLLIAERTARLGG